MLKDAATSTVIAQAQNLSQSSSSVHQPRNHHRRKTGIPRCEIHRVPPKVFGSLSWLWRPSYRVRRYDDLDHSIRRISRARHLRNSVGIYWSCSDREGKGKDYFFSPPTEQPIDYPKSKYLSTKLLATTATPTSWWWCDASKHGREWCYIFI